MIHIQSTPSLARLWRQICYVPYWHNRWLDKRAKQAFNDAISHAEQGHQGEIYLIIENHLPIASAYYMDCRERAVALFGEHRVWDTECNTGVLIYINLCEHSLQIIADRGIDKKSQQATWDHLYQKTAQAFYNKDFQNGILALINDIGVLLKTHYPSDDVHGNELVDNMVHLT